MKQGAPLRRTELKRGKPLKASRKKRLGAGDRAAAAIFKASVLGQPCAACGTPWQAPDAHHVVSAQTLRKLGLPVYHPDNALPLCPIGSTAGHACHELHENGHRRVPRAVLTEANLNYASAVLGERAGFYLARFYA